jgi:hypothetical protein
VVYDQSNLCCHTRPGHINTPKCNQWKCTTWTKTSCCKAPCNDLGRGFEGGFEAQGVWQIEPRDIFGKEYPVPMFRCSGSTVRLERLKKPVPVNFFKTLVIVFFPLHYSSRLSVQQPSLQHQTTSSSPPPLHPSLLKIYLLAKTFSFSFLLSMTPGRPRQRNKVTSSDNYTNNKTTTTHLLLP